MTNFFDQPPDALWQPWQPKPGDRVRVRLSGECRAELPPECAGRLYGLVFAHEGIPDGVTGTVVAMEGYGPNLAHFERIGHTTAVSFDERVRVGGIEWKEVEFAPSELEALGEAADVG